MHGGHPGGQPHGLRVVSSGPGVVGPGPGVVGPGPGVVGSGPGVAKIIFLISVLIKFI